MNSFVKNIEMQHLSARMQEQGTDIMRNENLLAEFQQNPLHNTRVGLKNEHHNFVSTPTYELLPLGSTYLLQIPLQLLEPEIRGLKPDI